MWRRRKREKGERPWFEAGLFTVMGPAQVGDVNAPLTYTPTAADLQCDRCKQPWDQHTVSRADNRTIAHCP